MGPVIWGVRKYTSVLIKLFGGVEQRAVQVKSQSPTIQTMIDRYIIIFVVIVILLLFITKSYSQYEVQKFKKTRTTHSKIYRHINKLIANKFKTSCI